MKKMKNNYKILGLGTDIIEIDRIQESIDNHGQTFLNKLFSKNEQEYCHKFKKESAARFAARFAAKEALAKALGCGFGKDFGFLDCEILNHENGKPHIILSEKAIKLFNNPNLHLSMSHCKTFATAVVIWEGSF